LSRDCLDAGLGCTWIDAEIGFDCASCPMCGGNTCVDLDTSLSNCGGCGTVCAPEHAVGRCAAGVCQIASCREGWQDEDGSAANGCEEEEGCAATPPTRLAALLLPLFLWLRRRS
jgi:uncharacterized protein (TIGR03382 family)